MKKVLYLLSALFLTVAVLGILPVNGEEVVYEKVIRLHVLANSNDEEDQELKLKVRDGVLSEVRDILSDTEDFSSAREKLSRAENIEKIRLSAEEIIREEGYSYPVSVSLTKEDYPRKNYEKLCFPSGNYTSLKVEIGESEGQNWWCVLFPRLCLGVATGVSDEDSFISAGFTPEQYKIVTESEDSNYRIKLKLLEVLKEAVE